MPYIFNQTELCELVIISHLISSPLQKPSDDDDDESDKDDGDDGDGSGGGNDSDDAVAASDQDDDYTVFQPQVMVVMGQYKSEKSRLQSQKGQMENCAVNGERSVQRTQCIYIWSVVQLIGL